MSRHRFRNRTMKTRRFFVFILIALALGGPLLAAEEGHGGWGWSETAGRWINLLILFGGLTYFIRQPAREFFSSRKADLQRQMRRAEEARREAEAKLAEAEERMKQLDSQLEAIRRQAREEAEREKERIRKQAEEEVKRIVSVAEREISSLGRSVRQELKDYAAEIAVQMAGDRLRDRMDSESHSALTEQFLADFKTEDRRN